MVLFPCPDYEFLWELWRPSVLSSFLSLGTDQASELQGRAARSLIFWPSLEFPKHYLRPLFSRCSWTGQSSHTSVLSFRWQPGLPTSSFQIQPKAVLFRKKASKWDKFLSRQPIILWVGLADSILSSTGFCHITIQEMVTETCLPHTQKPYLGGEVNSYVCVYLYLNVCVYI